MVYTKDHFRFSEEDHAFLVREIQPYLPDRIFDAHAHLFCHAHYTEGTLPANLGGTPNEIGFDVYREYAEWIHPEGRTAGGLFFGLAFTGDRDANNRFVADEVARGRKAGFVVHGQMIVSPDMDVDTVRDTVRTYGFRGLKPYHTMAEVDGPTFLAPIEAYLPEQFVQLAHEEGLTVTLHMVRERALADPANQETIRRYCKSYPNMTLILAHAARGFNPWHTIEGIGSLTGLDNVWFDTAAVTEAGAFEAIVDAFGHRRLLYGSDFHVSHLRGRCVAIGDSFHWFYADEMDLDEKHTTLRPVLVGLESLRSLLLACRRLRLTDRQMEDVFYHNAVEMLAQ